MGVTAIRIPSWIPEESKSLLEESDQRVQKMDCLNSALSQLVQESRKQGREGCAPRNLHVRGLAGEDLRTVPSPRPTQPPNASPMRHVGTRDKTQPRHLLERGVYLFQERKVK
jgi:hypothetical protein